MREKEVFASLCPVITPGSHSRTRTEQARKAVEKKPLIAYRIGGVPLEIVPALPDREWMNASNTVFANRCLPLRIANQSGWFVLNNQGFEVVWNGGREQSDLTLIPLVQGQKLPALSHFGHGILTFWLAYLFRTPPGWNMHVRGPANWLKDGIIPLEAIVETDWSVASFTMNWKITRPGSPIRFYAGEPICMISPVQRGDLECFVPEIRRMEEEPKLEANYRTWSLSRKQFSESLSYLSAEGGWQKHYFVGNHPSQSSRFPEHQVSREVATFVDTTEVSKAANDNMLVRRKDRMTPSATKSTSQQQTKNEPHVNMNKKKGSPKRAAAKMKLDSEPRKKG